MYRNKKKSGKSQLTPVGNKGHQRPEGYTDTESSWDSRKKKKKKEVWIKIQSFIGGSGSVYMFNAGNYRLKKKSKENVSQENAASYREREG